MKRKRPKNLPLPTGVRFSLLAIALLAAAGWTWLAGVIHRPSGGDATVAAVSTRPAAAVVPTATTEPNELPSPPNEPAPVRLLIVGDVMLGRYVETLMTKNGDDYPFAKLDGFLDGHDLVIGNLEGPIVREHRQTPNDSLVFSFAESAALLLAKQGFTHLTIANNHGLDQGPAGADETRTALRKVEIIPFGDAVSVEAQDVARTVVNGNEIMLIGLHATTSAFDLQTATEMIAGFRAESPDVFILVTPHWGNEYQETSSTRQQSWAHALVDAGADAVIGHHPHVVQEAELYRNRMIVYSLGNFIFDQYFSDETQIGLALEIEIGAEVGYHFFPLVSEQSQPRLMVGEELDDWRATFLRKSPTLALKNGLLTLPQKTKNE